MTTVDHDLIRGALTVEQANAAYDVLVELSGASDDERDRFVFVAVQTRCRCDEYRFQGSLGFGGKFWRCNNRWYVTAYPEDVKARPGRQALIDATNDQLAKLLAVEWRML